MRAGECDTHSPGAARAPAARGVCASRRGMACLRSALGGVAELVTQVMRRRRWRGPRHTCTNSTGLRCGDEAETHSYVSDLSVPTGGELEDELTR